MKPLPLSTVTKLSITFSFLGLLFITAGIRIGTGAGLIVLGLGLLLLVGTIIFLALFYRCPHCGGFLTIWYHNHHCPHCGSFLE